jgi:iron complex transport system substrate-binding protein
MGIRHSRRRLSTFVLTASTLLAVALLVAILAGCGSAASATPPGPEKPLLAKDADGTSIVIPAKAPEHIVSLGASDSEILGALGASSQVVAVDYYTNYPASMASKSKISDANGNYNVESIVALQPDLVLSFGGETRTVDQQLEAVHITVVDIPQLDLTGTLLEIRLVGQLIHAEAVANRVVAGLQQRIDVVKAKVAGAPKISVYMEVGYIAPNAYVFGGTSFGDELIRDAGGTNVFGSDTGNGGYPTVGEESIIAANPQVVVLTENPAYGGDPSLVYQRQGWSVISAVQTHRVYALDPDESQRAGPRLVDALEQLAQLLHPNLFS